MTPAIVAKLIDTSPDMLLNKRGVSALEGHAEKLRMYRRLLMVAGLPRSFYAGVVAETECILGFPGLPIIGESWVLKDPELKLKLDQAIRRCDEALIIEHRANPGLF